MCELLGLSFNQPVNPTFSFRSLCNRDNDNPHGWGIARFDGKACQIFKEPIRASQSKLAKFLKNYELFKSKIFIAHLRDASCGDHTLQNTHPFLREFRGREIALVHNGTLDIDKLKQNYSLKFYPIGETDSEYLFCALLTKMSSEDVKLSEFEKIQSLLKEFNQYGTMNLLFSEGEHLYCYRDIKGYNGLYAVERKAPFEKISLCDEDFEINLWEDKNLNQKGFVIASHPLTKEKWSELPAGSLVILKNGEYIYFNKNK